MAQMSSLKVKVCPIEWKWRFVWSHSFFIFLWILLVDETGWIGWLSDNNSIFSHYLYFVKLLKLKGLLLLVLIKYTD